MVADVADRYPAARCADGDSGAVRAVGRRRKAVVGGVPPFRTGDGIDVWSTNRLQQALAENALWP